MSLKRKWANEDRTADYVHSLPTPSTGRSDAANTTLGMEDGPVPMKNLKPVKKHPTGVDNFVQEHLAELDARGKMADQLRRVETHNNANPKLKDELDRRRSVSKITAVNLKRNADATQRTPIYDPKCKICVKLRRAERKKNPKVDRRTVKRKDREKRSRVTKSKKPQRKRMNDTLRIMKFKTNRTVQHFPHTVNAGTSPERNIKLTSLIFKMADEKPALTIDSLSREFIKQSQSKAGAAVKKSRTSINSGVSKSASKSDAGSKKYPDTSVPSVSSYNSYLSMDHEPMVKP